MVSNIEWSYSVNAVRSRLICDPERKGLKIMHLLHLWHYFIVIIIYYFVYRINANYIYIFQVYVSIDLLHACMHIFFVI